MTRAVPEWIGKTDDSKVPPRVRDRIFEAHGGRCWISGRLIGPADQWDLDHKVALINGGEHRESNLAPAIRDKHRAKTAEDVAQKAYSAKVRQRHRGIKPDRPSFQTNRNAKFKRKLDGTIERRSSPSKSRSAEQTE